jgi:DNA segregation ATPase FtsK/SpoIIIE-like protein
LAQHYDATELRFSLIDPKGTELIFFSEDPHLDGEIGLTADDAKYILEKAVDEMDKRYALFVNSRVNGIKPYNSKVEAAERIPWWIIVLDEYADLTSDKEMKKEIEALLQRLAQKARAAGIHVIVATQKPTVDVINTVVRSNLPAQLALRVNRAVESRVIIGDDGAEALTGKGDALLNAEGQLTRFQSAMYES